MAKPANFLKTAIDLFWVQLTWTFWFLGILFLINIGKIIFQANTDSFYSAGYIATNIYMLVIGIIVITFLPYFVGNGVTRKHYFFGNVIASIGLSIVIPIMIYIISLLEKLVFSEVISNFLNQRIIEEVVVDIDGHIIGEIVLSFILTPFVSPDSNVVLSLVIFSLHILIFYLVGWLIGSAFYRLGVIGGLAIIAIGILLIAMKDSMIRLFLDVSLFKTFSLFGTVPESLALPVVFLLIVVIYTLIRLLTKRAPIKI